MPANRYHFAYRPDSPYGHAVRLLAEHTHVEDGVVVDIGCGYGAIAEPLRELRLAYIGVDREPTGVADICHRGFEGAVVDLGEPDRLGPRIAELLAGRPLAALSALDVLEHLTNGPDILAALRQVAIDHGRVPLVVSIPNVAHLDLAAKLLVGRWDVTVTGLLDETHVALYAPGRLEEAFAATGWAEVGQADFELVESDQHFPADSAVLAPTPLHELLAHIRRRAAPGVTTNQFVRAYVPVAVPPPLPAVTVPPPFLSVLLLDGGDDERLADALTALDAQELPGGELEGGPASLEILCCTTEPTPARRRALEALVAPFTSRIAHRFRVVAAPPGPAGEDLGRAGLLDAGCSAALGRYVTVLDDGDLPFAHWLATFARLAEERPGAVLRSLALSQPRRALSWPGGRPGHEPAAMAEVASRPHFDLVDHLRHGGSPPGSYALPRSYLCELGGRFAGGTPGLEEDELLARAAMACGVHEDPATAILLCRPPADEGHPPAPPAPRAALVAALDAEPLLLPAGALASLVAAAHALEAVAPATTGPATSDAPEAVAPASDLAAADAAKLAPTDPSGEERRFEADRTGEVARDRAEREEAVEGRRLAEEALAAARAELAATRAELASVRDSTSWRVTAPLRRLGERRPR